MTPYIYRAQCVNVVDGDTVDLFCDDGRHRYSLERYRLIGIDTPEMHAPEAEVRQRALDAKAALVSLLGPAPPDLKRWPLLVRTHKGDSFGRWLADVWTTSAGEPHQHVNQLMLERGFAVVRLK